MACASSPGKTALITGASSGIGYELAKRFARDGYRLVLVARDADRLNRIANELRAEGPGIVSVMPHDLARPDAAETLIAHLRESGIAVDVLVNNAGFAVYGRFVDTDPNAERDMVQLNVVTLTRLTKLLVGEMVERGEGKILNVASTAALQPGPLMAVYYATKAYVLSFSEALAEELRGTGVTVTALCPGMTRTEFQRRAGITRSRLVRSGMMSAEVVARLGYRGLLQGRAVVITGWRNRFLALVVRLAPRRLVTRVVRLLQEQTTRSLDAGQR